MRSIKMKDLERIETLMPTKEADAVSIAHLAKKMKCSYMAAKRRMEKYAEREGLKLKTTTRREGLAGPESVCFYV